MFRFLLVLFCISYAQGGILPPKPRLSGRIVGGVEVDIKEIPFQVSLQHYGGHFCGGSFISKNFILTAAHCTMGSTAASLTVRAGSTQYARGGAVLSVKRVFVNPNYNSNSIDYDFSLLELKDWNSTGLVHGVAKLPKQNEDVPDGALVRVSGWGNTQNSQESRSNLRAVEVPKVNQDACNDAYRFYGGVTARMICAGYTSGGKDSCQGDSGGPLALNGTLVGVVSWGFGCAQPKYPGVYSRVSSVREWIKQISGV